MIRLMTLAPGHYHAALVQMRPLHGVHHRVHVYAPLDGDTLAHLARVAAFNCRRESPTAWEIDLRSGGDYLARFAREQPGNTVILSGRNRSKIDLMELCVQNCIHVLADKPWIIDHAHFPRLAELYRQAELRDVLVWDMLTERFEIANWLQRELVRDTALFGAWQTGTRDRPALVLHSVHNLKKTVNGLPLTRPWWWFDPTTSGHAMADVGTHLADLALWLISPEQPIDYTTEIDVLDADRTPLLLTEDEFRQVTRLPHYPTELKHRIVNGQLYYTGTNTANLTLRGVHTLLITGWEFEAPGGDTHQSCARGTRSTVSVRQQPAGPPELFVAATAPAEHSAVVTQLREKCDSLQRDFAGMSVVDLGHEAQITIPESWRAGHEDHFGAVMDEFVRYFHTPRAVPAWEKPNALARYYITTKAVELANGMGM